MKKIGITGVIGSGKTTVSYLLRRFGYAVFDADNYSRICFQKTHPAYQKIVEVFTTDILDEHAEISRSKLATIVFQNPDKKKELESIVHPYIRQGLHQFFLNHQNDTLVFAEIPLLYEVGWEDQFDDVLLVVCKEEVSIQRLMEDRNYSFEEAKLRIQNQMPIEQKTEKADFVIENNGTIKELAMSLQKWLIENEELCS